MSEDKENTNNNNSLINLSLSSMIVFAGIIIFLWFAFQTLFKIIFYQVLDHCGILPVENNNIVNQSRRNE